MKSAKRRNTALAFAMAAGLAGVLALPVARAHAADSGSSRTGSRAFLGVRMQELTDDLRDSYDYRGAGVLVSSVTDGSPADKLGITDGDIITKLDDMPVNDPDQLARRIGSRSPGSLVSVWVWRDGKEISLGRIALGSQDDRSDDSNRSDRRVIVRRVPRAAEAPEAPEAPEPPAPPSAPRHSYHGHDDGDQHRDVHIHVHGDGNGDEHGDGDGDMDMDMGDLPQLQGLRGLEGLGHGNGAMAMAFGRGRLGVELSDLDSDLGSYFKREGGHGVLVTRVVEDTPAARAGLKAGDVITSFDGHAVESSDDLRRLVQEQGAGNVDVRVRRHGDERTLTARLGERNNMSFRGLPGAGNWDDKGKADRRVYRYRFPGGGDAWGQDGQKLSPEDRAQLRKDMQQLRKDMQQMHKEMRVNIKGGDDDSRDEGKDDGKDDARDDDGDDDDSGN